MRNRGRTKQRLGRREQRDAAPCGDERLLTGARRTGHGTCGLSLLVGLIEGCKDAIDISAPGEQLLDLDEVLLLDLRVGPQLIHEGNGGARLLVCDQFLENGVG